MSRVITEHDIIAARLHVAVAEAKNEQQDFADALLASPDLTPEMVKKWLDARVHVHWCACEKADHARIVCTECGLPPYWQTQRQHLINQARALCASLADIHRRMTRPDDDWEAVNDERLDQIEAMLVQAHRRLSRREGTDQP